MRSTDNALTSAKGSSTLTQVGLASKREGFTLIELLVVISIISLLSTVIFAVFSTSRAQAQDAAKKETVHSVQQALELYQSTYGTYPNNYTCTDPNTCTVGRTSPAVQGDTEGDGDWAYKKSTQELVTANILPSIPEANSGPGYAYYNAGNSATFFTGLNGGYGGVASSGSYFPPLIFLPPPNVQYVEDQTTIDCNTPSTNIDYSDWKCFIIKNHGNGTADFYIYRVPQVDLDPYSNVGLYCYDTSELSEEYKSCVAVGVSTYTEDHSDDFLGCDTTSCDTLLGDPINPPQCFSSLPVKFSPRLCLSTTPAFCTHVGVPDGRAVCYWTK